MKVPLFRHVFHLLQITDQPLLAELKKSFIESRLASRMNSGIAQVGVPAKGRNSKAALATELVLHLAEVRPPLYLASVALHF